MFDLALLATPARGMTPVDDMNPCIERLELDDVLPAPGQSDIDLPGVPPGPWLRMVALDRIWDRLAESGPRGLRVDDGPYVFKDGGWQPSTEEVSTSVQHVES